MRYTIEFELPDNETVLDRVQAIPIQWGFLGFGGQAKAKPSTHAHWILGGAHEFDEGITNIMHCSNCKAYFRYQGRKKNVNYCYRCGAVMDEPMKFKQK